MFDPRVVEPAVDLLAALAGTGGTALELGTGRLALPLARRGTRVHGIDLSPAMLDQLRARPGGSDIAGLRLRERYGTWTRAPFTGHSRDRISVWAKLR